MNRYIRSLLLSLICLLPACTTKPATTNNVSHRLTRSFDELGAVGVVVTNRLHNFAVNTPLVRGEAWQKGREINKQTFMPVAYVPVQEGMMLLPMEFFIHAMVTLNAATMSAFGVPKEDFLAAQANIKQVCIDLERGGNVCFNERLKSAVTEEWDALGVTPVVYLEPVITSAMQRSTLYPNIFFPSTLPPDENPRGYLISKGVKTLLEVQIKDCGLKRHGKFNPTFAIEISGYVRLVSMDNNTELAARPFEYRGKRLGFLVWGDKSGEFMRSEVAACYKGIAKEVVSSVVK